MQESNTRWANNTCKSQGPKSSHTITAAKTLSNLNVNLRLITVFTTAPPMTRRIRRMRVFRLPPRYQRDLRSSGTLHSVDWYLLSDVSGQPIGLLNSWKWDGLVVPKRPQTTTRLHCVTSQKRDELESGEHSHTYGMFRVRCAKMSVKIRVILSNKCCINVCLLVVGC